MKKTVKTVRVTRKKSDTTKPEKKLSAANIEECVLNELKSKQTDLPLIAIGRDNANRVIFVKYDFMRDQWSNVQDTGASMETKPGVGYYDKKVFFIGGEDCRGNKLNNASFYDMETESLEKLPNIFFPRSLPAICGIGNSVLVIGGQGRFSRQGLTIVEELNLSFPKWVTRQSMKKRRADGARTMTLNGMAVVAGGGSLHCELFNPRNSVWSLTKPVPSDVVPDTAFYAVGDNKLYAFKYFKPDFVCVLDLKYEDDWKIVNCTGRPPDWAIGAVGWKSIIFVLDKSKIVYILDVVNNCWSIITKLPRQIVHPVCIAL